MSDKVKEFIKEKQNALHNPFYSIDLNTNRVKQNEQPTFIINNMNKKNRVSA